MKDEPEEILSMQKERQKARNNQKEGNTYKMLKQILHMDITLIPKSYKESISKNIESNHSMMVDVKY